MPIIGVLRPAMRERKSKRAPLPTLREIIAQPSCTSVRRPVSAMLNTLLRYTRNEE
jgi:hypothetical protein